MESRLGLLAVAVIIISCAKPVADRPPPPGPAPVAHRQPALTERLLAVHRRMHDRYQAARRIEQAVALGDLTLARRHAESIAELDEPDVLPQWRPFFDTIRSRAHDVTEATNLVAAARLTATLAGQCADCHLTTSATIEFVDQPRPAKSQIMSTHQWAAARMFDGLIGPSQPRWREAADQLANAPLTFVAEDDSLGLANDVARVHLLARRAPELTTTADRVALYSELLATCAGCHYKIRDVRGP